MAVNYVNLKCLDPFISHFKNCVGCSYQYYKLQLFARSGDLFITAISVWNGFGILSLNKIWECLALCPGFSWDRVNYPFSSWWSVKEIKTVSGNCLGRDIETARRTPFPACSQAAEAGCLLPLVDGKQEWDWAQLVAEWGYPAAAWEADFASLRKPLTPSLPHRMPALAKTGSGTCLWKTRSLNQHLEALCFKIKQGLKSC